VTLKLVRDEPTKPPRRKARRHDADVLTADEQRQARQALRNLRDAFGCYGALAKAMGVPYNTVHHAASAGPVSAAVLVRAMRASSLTLAELLGGPVPADRCRACGQIKRRAA
jgi:hypothetical protein